jgi:malate dehydrogenase (oxaloacetate-decarboxylating)(NADP+)
MHSFYAILCKHTTETMPFVYTPTVGQACLDWGKIYRHTPRGMYLSIRDKGMIRDILDNYPHKGIKVVVFTDGERILGLGDLGVNGMGIPIGKLALYTACAGIHPSECLPVHIDVGIDREELRNDPTYMGLRQARVRGQEYDELIAEFIDACQDAYGRQVLLQFEDFGNSNAFRLLDDHKEKATVFNDDIQGTASVVLAGIISSLPLVNKQKLAEHRFLFYGAGEAGVGIGNQISSYIQKELGCSLAEARTKVWFVDSKGLITNARGDKLAHHKEPYAHPPPAPLTGSDVTDSVLLDAVRRLQPTALIGVSAVGGAFDEQVVKEMASLNADPAAPPLIFALSNPTTKAECTAEQAYTWTNGHVVYASGSPFDPVDVGGKHFVPGQGNNAYIFPGVGLGAVAAGALTLTDDDFSVAAASLAAQVTPDRLAVGCAYPPLKDIREVSLRIAADVAWHIIKEARCSADIASTLTTYDDVVAKCRSMMYTPAYH